MKVINKLLFVSLPLAILAGGWWFIAHKNGDISSPETEEVSKRSPTELNNTEQHEIFNPLASSNESTNSKPASTQSTLNQQDSNDNAQANSEAPTQDLEVASIALEPLSDEEFKRLESLLKKDANLRLELLAEFRNNLDPRRAKQLAALLGPYNDPEIVQTASELAYSGYEESQRVGLDLLSRLQPHNNEARDVAINLLSSEGDYSMLVATMNVLATPSRTATPDQRQLLADNLNNLSSHPDASVRAHSIALMGRWDKNSAASQEAFTRGLSDNDPAVRARAAYAVNNVQNPNANLINGLLAIAEDTTEKKSTRYAALTALSNMQLPTVAMRRYNAAKTNVSRRAP